MIEKERLIQEFLELVQIDSESGNEQRISQLLKHKLGDLGLVVREDSSAEVTGLGSGNLFATWEAYGALANAPTLLLTCHMDTVKPGIGIKPRIDEDGYIRSDGTTILGSDDKAGIAALLAAIRAVQEQDLPHCRVQIVITAGEESGLLGARAIDSSWLEADYGFALDSNGAVGDIAVAAPTQAKVTIKIFGKSAHAGVNPEDGISAIQVASKVVSAMRLGRIDKETTANIGRISGGGATNIVCDYVELEAEARSIVAEKLEAQLDAMREAVQKTAEAYGARGELNSEIIYPAYRYDENHAVVRLAGEALRSIGKTPRTFHSGGGSDANVFNGHGVPTVNLAVGYEHIHTTKEQIKTQSLVDLAELVVSIMQRGASFKKA